MEDNRRRKQWQVKDVQESGLETPGTEEWAGEGLGSSESDSEQ